MVKHVGVKRGDTLIEVLVATGIFSLIAVAVVAIMNVGTLNLQTSLETTTTREEIDAQAEAIRFIHAGYVAEKLAKNDSGAYGLIWNKITDLAKANDETVANYSPNTCSELYEHQAGDNSTIEKQNAFIINTRKLGEMNTASLEKTSEQKALQNDIVVVAKETQDEEMFGEAMLYPRMVFNEGTTLASATVQKTNYDELYQAQGVYIVGKIDEKSTYYDFYIRTCWVNSGTSVPSTISTIIRLYNPDYTVTTE